MKLDMFSRPLLMLLLVISSHLFCGEVNAKPNPNPSDLNANLPEAEPMPAENQSSNAGWFTLLSITLGLGAIYGVSKLSEGKANSDY